MRKILQSDLWKWFACIFFPFLVELILELIVLVVYGGLVIYFLLFKNGNINNLELIVFIYLAFAWLYSIYSFLRYGVAIPKSLWKFPGLVKNFIFKNPLKVIPVIIVIVISWHILFKTESIAPITKLDQIKSNIESLTETIDNSIKEIDSLSSEQVTDINSFINNDTYKKFLNAPNIEELPKTIEDLNTLSGEFINFWNEVEGNKQAISGKNQSIKRLENLLGSYNQQLESFDAQLKAFCHQKENSNTVCEADIDENLLIKISNLRKSISSASTSLNDSKQKLESIQKISVTTLGIWKTKIERLRGQLSFSEKEIKEWINYTNTEIASVEIKLSEFTQKNQDIRTKIQRLTDLVKSLPDIQKLHELSNQFTDFEGKSLDSSNINFVEQKVKENNHYLQELMINITQMQESVQQLDKEAKEHLGNLIFTQAHLEAISIDGHLKSLQADEHPKGKEYLGKINGIKQEADNLQNQSIKPLEQELSNLVNEINSQLKTSLETFLDDNLSLIHNLKARNDSLKKKIDVAKLRSNIIKVILALVLISLVVVFAWYQYRKSTFDRSRKIGNNKLELIKIIADPKEIRDVRLNALKKLEKQSVTLKDIIRFKTTIISLDNLEGDDNKDVVATLRKITYSLEQRLSEERNVT